MAYENNSVVRGSGSGQVSDATSLAGEWAAAREGLNAAEARYTTAQEELREATSREQQAWERLSNMARPVTLPPNQATGNPWPNPLIR